MKNGVPKGYLSKIAHNLNLATDEAPYRLRLQLAVNEVSNALRYIEKHGFTAEPQQPHKEKKENE